MTGAVTGGGSHNGSWAISSGGWAGAAAARFATARPAAGVLSPRGQAGLRPRGRPGIGSREVVGVVQDQVFPLLRNRFRTESRLREALSVLDDLWRTTADGLGSDGARSRQAAAMVAHARWMYASALRRPESRGLQIRDDKPHTDETLAHRIRSGGLDEVWTAPEEVRAA